MKVRGDVIVHLSCDLKDHLKVNVSLLLLWLLMVKMRTMVMLKETLMMTSMMKMMIQKDD